MCLAVVGNEQSKERGISLLLPFLSTADFIQTGRAGDPRLVFFRRKWCRNTLLSHLLYSCDAVFQSRNQSMGMQSPRLSTLPNNSLLLFYFKCWNASLLVKGHSSYSCKALGLKTESESLWVSFSVSQHLEHLHHLAQVQIWLFEITEDVGFLLKTRLFWSI